jgi:hypothetical protein
VVLPHSLAPGAQCCYNGTRDTMSPTSIRGVFSVGSVQMLYLETESKTRTYRGLVYGAKGRIFNNMLYVRYVHLTQAKRSLFIIDKPILLSGRTLHKDSECNGSVAKKKKSNCDPQGALCKDELIDSKLPVIK